MTNDQKSIVLPIWVISVLMSVLTASIVAWGIVSTVRTKIDRATQDIEIIRKEKVAREEFQMILERLNTIERKLDSYSSINDKSSN